MNKSNGDFPEHETRLVSPDISRLFDRSRELEMRTRAVFEDLNELSRRLHTAIAQSSKLLEKNDHRRQQ